MSQLNAKHTQSWKWQLFQISAGGARTAGAGTARPRACRARAARDWQDTDRKAMSSCFSSSFCFSSSGFPLAWNSQLLIISLCCHAAADPRPSPGCSGANARGQSPFPEPGASATSAGFKEGGKGISSGSAGSLCVLLVCGIPILFTCLGRAEGDEPWAHHKKPVVLQARRSWCHTV